MTLSQNGVISPEQAAKLRELVCKTVDTHLDCTVLDGCTTSAIRMKLKDVDLAEDTLDAYIKSITGE